MEGQGAIADISLLLVQIKLRTGHIKTATYGRLNQKKVKKNK